MGMEARLRQVPWGTLALYGLTLACEFPVVCARVFVMLMLATFAFFIVPGIGAIIGLGIVFAYVPMILSALALIPQVGYIGDGRLWRTRAGGREPSAREREAYNEAIVMLQQYSNTPLPLPKDWFVTDTQSLDAAVCGRTLMLSRSMLEHPYLPAVIAHELGHLKAWDSRFCAALNRLVVQDWPKLRSSGEGPSVAPVALGAIWVLGPMAPIVWLMRKAYTCCRGGLGLWALRPLWGMRWRADEYRADHYAATLGQADDLATFLELNALLLDQPMPFTWLADYTHPPVELRIDRLRAHTQIQHTPPTELALGRPATPPIQEELPGLQGIPT